MSHRSKASKRQPRETKGPEVAAGSNEPAEKYRHRYGNKPVENELYVNAAVRKGVTVRYDRHRRLLVRASARGACRRASKELATYRLRESKGSGLADCSQRRVSWKGFATASDGATIATGDSDGQLVEEAAASGGAAAPRRSSTLNSNAGGARASEPRPRKLKTPFQGLLAFRF